MTLHIAKKRASGPKCAKTNVRLPGVSARCTFIVRLSQSVSLPARLGLLRRFVYIGWARQPLLKKQERLRMGEARGPRPI